jgi:hypothetical protein
MCTCAFKPPRLQIRDSYDESIRSRDNQLSADSFHMKEASPLSDMFPVNSNVLLKPPEGAREKLQMPKAGPYIVVGINRDKYSIQDLLTH